MTKIQALQTIIADARAVKASHSSFKRVAKALSTLGLDDREQAIILFDLDYANDDGVVYARYFYPKGKAA